MKLSTRTRYGLRAMVELARRSGEGPVSMEAIARSQALSRKYLHALLSTLRRAGLVKSLRGASGGFVTSRPPAELTLGEVVRALEGPLDLVRCVTDGRACSRSARCVTRGLWSELSRAMEDRLDGITLEDLAAEGVPPGAGEPRQKRRTRPARKGPVKKRSRS
jgi:Rrf2 family protein